MLVLVLVSVLGGGGVESASRFSLLASGFWLLASRITEKEMFVAGRMNVLMYSVLGTRYQCKNMVGRVGLGKVVSHGSSHLAFRITAEDLFVSASEESIYRPVCTYIPTVLYSVLGPNGRTTQVRSAPSLTAFRYHG